MSSVFWEDLERDLKDPQFLREYVTESVRIASIDTIINALDQARASAGLSKAKLARAIGADPATIRRLFSTSMANPTLGTLTEVAAALGLRISIEPLPKAERDAIMTPLQTGRASKTTAAHTARMRAKSKKFEAAA